MEPVELLRWGDLGGQGPARFLAEGRRHKGLDSTAEGQEGPRSWVSGDRDCLNQNKSTQVLSWGGGRMETALTLGSEDMGRSLSPALQPWLGRHCSLADWADAPPTLLPGHLLSQVPLWQRVVMWQSSGQWDVSRRQWGLLGKLLLYLVKGRDMAVPAFFPTSSLSWTKTWWLEHWQPTVDHEATRLRGGWENSRDSRPDTVVLNLFLTDIFG